MEGVEILNQFEVVTKTEFSWNSFWVGALIGVGVAIVVLLISFLSDPSFCCGVLGSVIISVITITIFALLLGILGGAVLKPKPVEFETHYEVTISPDVSMSDFMEKYEVLETRGFIYTVKDRHE